MMHRSRASKICVVRHAVPLPALLALCCMLSCGMRHWSRAAGAIVLDLAAHCARAHSWHCIRPPQLVPVRTSLPACCSSSPACRTQVVSLCTPARTPQASGVPNYTTSLPSRAYRSVHEAHRQQAAARAQPLAGKGAARAPRGCCMRCGAIRGSGPAGRRAARR